MGCSRIERQLPEALVALEVQSDEWHEAYEVIIGMAELVDAGGSRSAPVQKSIFW